MNRCAPRPTVSDVFNHLSSLAAEVAADLVHSIQAHDSGMLLVVHWTGTGPTDLPREAHVLFQTEGHPEGRFQLALVYDPTRYMHCVDEGLLAAQCEDESRRTVTTVKDLMSYLLGRPYRSTGRRCG